MKRYVPVDYTDRGPGTVVCDFNKRQFPDIQADVAFVSGCLEYVEDYRWFAEQVAQHVTRCILSYCTTDAFPRLEERRQYAWVNALSRQQVIELFGQAGMRLLIETRYEQKTSVFVFGR
jgi:hypothetical protein